MSNNSVKIQINSKDALERLIGGDNALEIEIRNSVVQDFSKKHLKSLAESQETLWRSLVDAAIKKKLENVIQYSRNSGQMVLTPTMDQAIADSIKSQIESVTWKIWESMKTEVVKTMVEDLMKGTSKDYLNKLIEEKARQLIEKKLKS